MKIGIIGGSGFRSFPSVETISEKTIHTPYGEAFFEEIQFHNQNLVFLPRHGKKHHIPPHQINYRANIFALHEMVSPTLLQPQLVALFVKIYNRECLVLAALTLNSLEIVKQLFMIILFLQQYTLIKPIHTQNFSINTWKLL